MKSMTGFGRAAGENSRYAIVVSMRGVNHRYLDLKIRLEEAFASAEAPLRKIFSKELFRGRVDVRIDVRRLGERRVQVHIRKGVVEALQREVRTLEEDGLVDGGLTTAELLRFPEVLRMEPEEESWQAPDEALLEDLARQALEQLQMARRAEGAQLSELLSSRLGSLEILGARLEEQREEALRVIREGLTKRLDDLLSGSKVEPERLEAEIAILVDRSDVQEELDRLGAHLEHFRSLMGEPKSIGKRLDFLAQEILRELNTLGAKCRNAGMIQSVLEAKAICEQLREQVQNVE